MKRQTKKKIFETLNDIQCNQFTDRDIEYLFISLREYSRRFPLFREFADLIAHNDGRDKGIVTDSQQLTYLTMRLQTQYDKDHPLDLSKSMPMWVKKLLMLQLNRVDHAYLRKTFHVSASILRKKINQIYVDDPKLQIAIRQPKQFLPKEVKAIDYLLSILHGGPEFTQDQLISELVNTIKENGIRFDEEKFLAQSNKITLCAILLLHGTIYKFESEHPSRTEISCEKKIPLSW